MAECITDFFTTFLRRLWSITEQTHCNQNIFVLRELEWQRKNQSKWENIYLFYTQCFYERNTRSKDPRVTSLSRFYDHSDWGLNIVTLFSEKS